MISSHTKILGKTWRFHENLESFEGNILGNWNTCKNILRLQNQTCEVSFEQLYTEPVNSGGVEGRGFGYSVAISLWGCLKNKRTLSEPLSAQFTSSPWYYTRWSISKIQFLLTQLEMIQRFHFHLWALSCRKKSSTNQTVFTLLIDSLGLTSLDQGNILKSLLFLRKHKEFWKFYSLKSFKLPWI